jgi:hypothetical protein
MGSSSTINTRMVSSFISVRSGVHGSPNRPGRVPKSHANLRPNPNLPWATLQHWHYDAFKAQWPDRTIEDALIAFSLNPDGSIDSTG